MNININPLSSNEIDSVIQLIKESFDTQVSPWYTPEGVQEFYKYIDLNAFKGRQFKDHEVYAAYMNDSLVGVIEIRNNKHISMLFINNDFRGQGIGTTLIKYIVNILRVQDIRTITVNSSPNSVDFYRNMGFNCIEEEKTINGIRFIQMKLEINTY